ncbi:MAG: glycoside hydrolase family 2 [Ignavibacteriae bacterium HGW-Ignavibacteriae-2]|jgi:hypothetical protein|nr:MAG: glycoside hydrolase family 2 [Ignavibacteriae bacterium HGW-Ignavibacteriae-2]
MMIKKYFLSKKIEYGKKIVQISKVISYQLIVFQLIFINVNCQNYGLSEPQDPKTLPQSLVQIKMPVQKNKIVEQTKLISDNDGSYNISGGWELIEASKIISDGKDISTPDFNTGEWYNATVPGTVLTTLIELGVYPDPYFGINNLAIPDSLCRKEWWYRVSFTMPKDYKGNKIWLNFDGINYKADIWLNGNLLGRITGAFKRGTFDVTDKINISGTNVLAVYIIPPPNPGIPHEESAAAGTGPNGGVLCLDGPTFISSEGWDWIPGIRDRNIGIWQNVSIKSSGNITLIDPQVITDLLLPDTTTAYLTINTEIKNNCSEEAIFSVKGVIDEVTFEQSLQLKPNETKTVSFAPDKYPQLCFVNPKLWWPNGYGKANLYNLNLTVIDNKGITSDYKTVRFGIRELSYDLTIDAGKKKNWRIDYNPIKALDSGRPILDNTILREAAPGTVIPALRNIKDTSLVSDGENIDCSPHLVVKVNGQRIYCKGGNWGMDDGLKRVSRERLEPYIRLQRDANFTMIRNWTGESTEKIFYDLCDEYGLLVWNDFWLSTEGWNLDVNDNELFLDNAKDVVKRFRNHPSIVIWCARNEGYPPADLEEGLSNIIASEDGTRLYQPNSRYLNLRPSGPWHYLKNPSEYYSERADGFSTELGTPSVPTAETMRAMMEPEDVWPISDVWYYHDLHDGQFAYRNDIDKLYGGPQKSLEEFCTKAQMVNYDSHRAMFESWNSKMWNAASGLLIWMSHPAWPSTMWQIYSSDYETFASYYAAKKACEPLHIQLNLHNNVVTTINTTLKSYQDVKAIFEVYDLNAKRILNKETNINLKANNRTDCYTVIWPGDLPAVHLVKLKLLDSYKNILSENLYWRWNGEGEKNFKQFNELPKVELAGKTKIEIEKKYIKIKAEITNPSASIALAVKLNLRNAESDQRILPAYFDDGYFTLLPGEVKIINIEFDKAIKGKMNLTAEGYNLDSHVLVSINTEK